MRLVSSRTKSCSPPRSAREVRGLSPARRENLHPDLLAALRARGLSVMSVRESGLAGADDWALLRLAKAEGRVDRTPASDFGTLAVLAQEPLVGIGYLRPGHILH